MKSNKGITLIALIITIIVLIILAGISIAVLTGEDGLITKTKQARQNMENATIEEQTRLNTLYAEMDSQLTTGSTNNSGTPVNQGGTGNGLTVEEHNILMSLGSMPSRGDFNPYKDSSNNAYAILQSNINAGSLYYESSVNVLGYDKIAFLRTNANGYSAYGNFKDAGNNNIGSISLASPNVWTDYIDIPSNAVSADIVIYATTGKVFCSMLTADSVYNPDNQ